MDSQENKVRRWMPVVASAVAVVALCAFIFYMSARPAVESDDMSLGVVGWFIGLVVPDYDQMSPEDQLYWQHALNHPVRKTAHFLEYAALGALAFNLVAQAVRARRREARAFGAPASELCLQGTLAWAFSAMYAATDEFHQIFVPGRAGMVADVLLDSAGALFGIIVAALAVYFARRSAHASARP